VAVAVAAGSAEAEAVAVAAEVATAAHTDGHVASRYGERDEEGRTTPPRAQICSWPDIEEQTQHALESALHAHACVTR